MNKSLAEIIDSLTVTNIKIYHLVDFIENENNSDSEVANAARKAQKLNRQRSQLMNEINERLNESGQIVKT